jgi:hypothetical protein
MVGHPAVGLDAEHDLHLGPQAHERELSHPVDDPVHLALSFQ